MFRRGLTIAMVFVACMGAGHVSYASTNNIYDAQQRVLGDLSAGARNAFYEMSAERRESVANYLVSEQAVREYADASRKLRSSLVRAEGNAPIQVSVGQMTLVATPFVEELTVTDAERSLQKGNSKRRVGWDFKSIGMAFVFGQFKQVMQYWYRGATIKSIDFCDAAVGGMTGDVSDSTHYDRSQSNIRQAWCKTRWTGRVGIGPVGGTWSRVQEMTVNVRGIVEKKWENDPV